MTSGEDDRDADLENDSEDQDRDGNVRDISNDYAPTGVESDDGEGSCCHWSTRRRFAPGAIQPVSQSTPDYRKPAHMIDLIRLVLFFAHV